MNTLLQRCFTVMALTATLFTILAAEYALKYQNNLKGLIIFNMMMNIPDYNAYAHEVLAKQMDPEVHGKRCGADPEQPFSIMPQRQPSFAV